MTREDIRVFIDNDDKLQWWAAVLFSEICELCNCQETGYGANEIFPLIVRKCQEWDKIVIGHLWIRAAVDWAKQNVEMAKGGK